MGDRNVKDPYDKYNNKKRQYSHKTGTLKRQVQENHRKMKAKEYPCTYIIEAEGTGLLKIGHTTNLPQRLSSMQTASACKLIVLRKIKGLHHEAVLHRNLKQFRQHGEWFKITNELVSYIDRYHRDSQDFKYLYDKPVLTVEPSS